MAATYEPIATTTLGSSQSSVTFSSLGAYTDIIVIFDGVNATGNNNDTYVRFNSDSGSNYSYTILLGSGSSAFSYRGSNQTALYCGNTNTTSGNTMVVQIQNYTNTTTYKTVLSRINNAANVVGASVGLWRNTAAITSMTFSSEKGAASFASGSTFTLYGIKAA